MEKKSLIVLSCILIVFCASAVLCAGYMQDDQLPTADNPVIAEGLIDFNVEGETDLKGNFFITFAGTRDMVMLDGDGNIVWSKHEEQPVEGESTSFWDFKKHIVGGKTYYSYHDETGTYEDFGMTGYGPGERVILDKNFKEIKRITLEESDVAEKGYGIDFHDFLLIDLNHYIMSAYICDTVYNVPGYPEGSSVLYSYLQEVKDGEVIWEFKSIDYPQFYEYSVNIADKSANDFANEITDAPDYMHFNSMTLDEKGNLICSFRHIESIISLDRTKSENQINWILSGKGDEFGLNQNQKCSHQHYVTVDGKFITAFDNNNFSRSSRVVSYKIDENSKELIAFKTLTLEGKFAWATGSAQHIKDQIYVIGWGVNVMDNTRMTVVDFSTGDILLEVSASESSFPAFTYRCVYYE